jgi:hypothetical protein
MGKRLLPLFIIVLIIVPIGLVFLLSKNKEIKLYQSTAINVIPMDAYWMIEARSVPDLFRAFSQSDPLFPSMMLFRNAKPYLEALRNMDSLLSRSSRFQSAWNDSPVVVSLHQLGKNNFQFLLVMETRESPGVKAMGDLFSEVCGRPGQWSERFYNGQAIHRISFGVDALIQGVSLAETDGFLILSPSPVLLENAVRQKAGGAGFSDTRQYRQLSVTRNEDALANVYINLKTLPQWLGSLMNPDVKRMLDGFNRYGDWAVMDLNLRNDALWLTGFALEGDTLNSYLNIFKSQLPLKLAEEQTLPANTAAFYTIGIEKPDLYFRDLSDYLAGGEQGRRRQSYLDLAVKTVREDIIQSWTELGISELTIAYLTGSADDSVYPVAMVTTRNRNQTLDKLLNWLDQSGGTKNNKNRSQRKIYRVDAEHEYAIYPMPCMNTPEILGGGFFANVKGEYFSFIGNTLVLADNIKTVEEVLHFHTIGRTLATDPFYLSVSDLITTRANATFYAVPHKIRPLLISVLSSKATASLVSDEDFLGNTGAVCLQFHNRDGIFLHSLFARFTGLELDKPQTIWESRLDAPVSGKPALVRNHSTDAIEIVVQDQIGNLYLLNSSGRILWKKPIGEQINSEIFQVDLMKNGRLQFLFSTPSAIHALDRTGNYLTKYPVALKSESTNGLSVIDFDGTRDFRLFIAGSDHQVYCLDKNGNQAKGWDFKGTDGPVSHTVSHYKIKSKDYLVFADDMKLYVLDRRGEIKVKYEKSLALSEKNPVIFDDQQSGKGSRFLATDVDGTLFSFYLDGSVESVKFENFGTDHYFISDDINQDGLKEYIFFDRNRLEIYKQTGEKLVSRRYEGQISARPEIFSTDSKSKRIGLVFSGKTNILLLQGDGTIYPGFPLRGSTPFEIGSFNSRTGFSNLLVGSQEPYLFNYAIK